jgi:predicted solute-binding protein
VVSYLNTVPLVWGFLHGDPSLREAFHLRFALPSACADQLASGDADIGIVPVIEMARLNLEYCRGTGIACHGPVRTILLLSKVPFRQVRTLAADHGSRTSVMLARLILAERFGVEPAVFARPPDVTAMLAEADAALIIGDEALRLDPAATPLECLDLGAEWVQLTGLPMVFAVWAGRPQMVTPAHERAFADSCGYGLDQMDAIVSAESAARGLPPDLCRRYLTRHIVFQLGARDYEGMSLFLHRVRSLSTRVFALSAPPA